MNEITKIVFNDLISTKEWFDVKVCFNSKIKVPYLIAQEFEESLKNIVIAFCHKDQFCHAELVSLFDSLSPPGDLGCYENGLLLAVVHDSSTVVYHKLLLGMYNVLPSNKAKRKEKT